MVEEFSKDERAYSRWRREHYRGFVFNFFGGPDDEYNLIHSASCTVLDRASDEGRRTAVAKHVSDDLDEPIAHVERLRADRGGWKRCNLCSPY